MVGAHHGVRPEFTSIFQILPITTKSLFDNNRQIIMNVFTNIAVVATHAGVGILFYLFIVS